MYFISWEKERYLDFVRQSVHSVALLLVVVVSVTALFASPEAAASVPRRQS